MATQVDYTSVSLGDDDLERRFEEELRRLRATESPVEPHLVGDKVIEAGELIERFDPCAPRSRGGAAREASAEVVRDAVAEAKAAFKGWKGTHHAERISRLREAGADIGTRIGSVAAIVSAETGKTRLEAVGETRHHVHTNG